MMNRCASPARGLPQKLARVKIEDAFVADRAVAAYQILASDLAVLLGDVKEMLITRLQARDGDNADVHHDVDEVGIGGEKGSQELSLGIEPGSHWLAARNDDLPAAVLAGEFPPLLPGWAQHESKIMNLIVVLTFLDQLAVMLGTGFPLVTQAKLIEQPHLSA